MSSRKIRISQKRSSVSSDPQESVIYQTINNYGGQNQVGNHNTQYNQSKSTTTLLKPDLKLLEDFSDTFPGDTVQGWFEQMEIQAFDFEMPFQIDAGLDRFRAHHRQFRSKDLKEVSDEFLRSLSQFTAFCSTTFYPLSNGLLRFYGGYSEIELMRNQKYEADKVKYVELARAVVSTWRNLQETVLKIAPEFEWNS